MRTVLLATSLFLSALLPNILIAEESRAGDLVLSTSHQVLDKMKEYREQGITDTAVLGKSLLSLLEPVVDFSSISKAVMGKYYDSATTEQKKRFTPIFKETMARLYAKTLVKLEIDEMHLNSDQVDGNKSKVAMEVKAADGNVYALNYSLRKNSADQWMVRNIIIDGINLGLTYRNQFYSAADQYEGDLDKVISGWSEEMDV